MSLSRYGNTADKRRSSTIVEIHSREKQREFLRKKLAFLRERKYQGDDTEPQADQQLHVGPAEPELNDIGDPVFDNGVESFSEHDAIPDDGIPNVPKGRSTTAAADSALNDRWRQLLPSLRRPLLTYMTNSIARPRSITDAEKLKSNCGIPGNCVVREVPILCLFYECKCFDGTSEVSKYFYRF